jgi:hypothetical protein
MQREVELNEIDPKIYDDFKTEDGDWAGWAAGAGSTVTGLATGAGIGAIVGGPIGMAIGAGIGTIVGAIGGAFAGVAAKEEAELRNETNRDNFKEISKAFASGETGASLPEITSWIQENGYAVGEAAEDMARSLLKNAKEIKEYGASLN